MDKKTEQLKEYIVFNGTKFVIEWYKGAERLALHDEIKNNKHQLSVVATNY